MSIYHYAYAPSDKHMICLYKKGVRKNHLFEGPVVYVKGRVFQLPVKYLILLLARFEEAHSGIIEYVPDWQLFESGDYLKPDDVGIDVGGDADNSIPLTHYLPELNSQQFIDDVMAEPSLIIE